jgi:hypothetical protein
MLEMIARQFLEFETATNERRAALPRRGAPIKRYRDWLFEKVLFVWEELGGATRTSVHGDGGPLTRFFKAACNPVFMGCSGHPPLTKHAVRGAVRKLLQERKPRDDPQK